MDSRVGRWSRAWLVGALLGVSTTNLVACPERTVRVCTSDQPLAGLEISAATYDCGCERWIDKL
jgi:hypothetical protein